MKDWDFGAVIGEALRNFLKARPPLPTSRTSDNENIIIVTNVQNSNKKSRRPFTFYITLSTRPFADAHRTHHTSRAGTE